jgi:PIN domain nuclease of toxin-antitoxin system
MRLLLDTHILLWALAEPKRIPARARAQIESPENDVLFSAASLWEVAIKVQTGRLTLGIPLDDLTAAAQAMGFRSCQSTPRMLSASHVCRCTTVTHSTASSLRKPCWNPRGCSRSMDR